ADVLLEGEFVKWLKYKNIKFNTISLKGTKEFGILEEYEKLEKVKCRPFNEIIYSKNYIIKKALDKQGEILAKKELAWYKKVAQLGFKNIPQIYEENPLKLELIQGKNIYEYNNLVYENKLVILEHLVNTLSNLHELESVPVDIKSFEENYLDKTFERIDKVKNLIPFATEKFITVNNRVCRNIFFYKEEVKELINNFKPKEFKLIHGDCTFSNIMLKNDQTPILIDPRGYFGKTQFYGDVIYDWAKLYYSLSGNYDQFNLKNFTLDIDENNKEITLKIKSNEWEKLEDKFFELINIDSMQIKLIHSLIWISLTTYAWENYDSICGAFYNGLYYLEECL
ncbi:nucleoside-diphosphate-sugar pyrophosphorylase, partial [Candidatus Epulonipiscium fishelsonii]